MQFIVPQFIDIESKIIGSISVRQFIILLVTAGMIYVAYELFNFWLFLLAGIIFASLAMVLAFVKINTQPFHIFLLNFIQTMKRPGLRIWRKELIKTKEKRLEKKEVKKVVIPKKRLSTSRLNELALLVDTGGAYLPEEEREKKEQIKNNIK